MGKIFYTFYNSDNISNIVESIKGKSEYLCTLPYYNSDAQILVSRVIYSFLEDSGLENLHQDIFVLINELLTIIDRINIKDEYYTKNDLNILTIEDYRKVKERYISDKFYEYYMEDLDSKDLLHFIKIFFTINKDSLNISIDFSHTLLNFEKEYIVESVNRAKAYKNINDVIRAKISNSDISWTMLFVIMLRYFNIDTETFFVEAGENGSHIDFEIPFSKITISKADLLTDEITKEINSLPLFPDSIVQLQKELMDPEWDFDRISDTVLSDPALTTEILRLVNSPVYNVIDKIDMVSTAVKKIGITGLKALLYNFGSIEVLSSRYDLEKVNRYKEHLFQVAIISSYIANVKKFNHFAEDIYVAALMHDIGKIIIESTNPELSKGFIDLAETSLIPFNIIDNLSEGYNHSVIGAKLTTKWNFPKKYVNSIRHHHSPEKVDSEYTIITYCVYLGNEISYFIKNRRKYSNINTSVLKFFGLETEEKFNTLIKEMQKEGLFLS